MFYFTCNHGLIRRHTIPNVTSVQRLIMTLAPSRAWTCRHSVRCERRFFVATAHSHYVRRHFVPLPVTSTATLATLAGLPEHQHRRLQSVLNAAARLIYRKSRCQHVTLLLQELHWLRSRELVDFKLAVLIFRCLQGLAPRYLTDDIRRVVDTNRRCLRSSSSALLKP